MTLLLGAAGACVILMGIIVLLKGHALNNKWDLEDHTDFSGDETCVCGKVYQIDDTGAWHCPTVKYPLDPQPIECYSCGKLLRGNEEDYLHTVSCDR